MKPEQIRQKIAALQAELLADPPKDEEMHPESFRRMWNHLRDADVYLETPLADYSLAVNPSKAPAEPSE